MNDKLFLESRKLYNDKEGLKECLEEYESEKHWIGVITPNNKVVFYEDSQKKFVKKLKELLCEIENDFDELE